MNSLMGRRFWDVVRVALVAVALVVAGCLAGCAQPAAEPAAQPETVAQQAAPVEGDGAEDEAPSPAAGGVATPSSAEALQVVGTQLCDQAGNPVQLRGVSTHGLAWYPGYVNPAFFTELRRDWNANVVRLALYTAENGGWRDELYNLVRDRMAAAVRAGLPVFVSEFGICDASGNGTIDRTSADAWVAVMNELGISYACWNLSNKDEASRCSKARAAKRRASPPTTCPKKAPGCGTCFMAKAKAPQAQQAR